MNILMTNAYLDTPGGSQTFTFTLGQELTRRGHRVTVYSPRVGWIAEKFRAAGIWVVDDPAAAPPPDVIHAHHRTETLRAWAQFPDVPIVLTVHGVLPWQEQPLPGFGNVREIVAVSEEVSQHVEVLTGRRAHIIRNGLDLTRFRPTCPPSPRPHAALILSNYMADAQRAQIKRVCGKRGIRILELIGWGQAAWDVEAWLNRADLVFGLGRSALEAMACERPTLVYDYQGGDGMVTSQTFQALRVRNFSGRVHHARYTDAELARELDRYDVHEARSLREIVRLEHNIETVADQYLLLYKAAGADFVPEPFSPSTIRALAEEIDQVRRELGGKTAELATILASRGWRNLERARRLRASLRSLWR
jgi:glycosyltransferase involved in cell wall biosynthesis